jgi:hypothetical protein
MNFTGFCVYRKYNNGNLLLLHLVNGNGFSDYRLAVELCYKSWEANEPFTEDVILCTFPHKYDSHNIPKPIFNAKYIGTEHEFDRDNFQYKYYGV